MKNKTITHLMLIITISIAVMGLIVETFLEFWELWMVPLLIISVISMWSMHLLHLREDRFRENLYLVIALTGSFFHAVHPTSLFDISVVSVILMAIFSLIYRVEIINYILAEYIVVMSYSLFTAFYFHTFAFTPLNFSRIILHIVAVSLAYLISRKTIYDYSVFLDKMQAKDEELRESDKDTEDFLANISHELRTPINVVNGISTLLLKKRDDQDVMSIHEAGLRLSNQIEDILDFTEIKRQDVILEEDKYMITSLVNDISEVYHRDYKKSSQEIIIDLDPNVPAMMRGDIRKIRKIFRHLLDNASKYTREGGIYLRIFSITRDYGVNLCIEVTDTGIGMSRKDISYAAKGLYQANKQRDRSTGGIGLGLYIVHGFVHKMRGFVKIDSRRGFGTTVNISIPQEVVDPNPCIQIEDKSINVIMYMMAGKFINPRLRVFYIDKARHFAESLGFPLYIVSTIEEVQDLVEQITVTQVLIGREEYESDAKYFDDLSQKDIMISIYSPTGVPTSEGSRVVNVPYSIYEYRVSNFLYDSEPQLPDDRLHPLFKGVRTLIVDDEPMNLVVASGLFRDYHMFTDTAESGQEAIDKFVVSEYDIVFMDHMMPEMDGVTAMKHLKRIALEENRKTVIIALTANAISGAREMFMKEGFDGFISKPIDISEFERVMKRVLPDSMITYVEGGQS